MKTYAFYAVRGGASPGIFLTRAEAVRVWEQQTHAAVKGFFSREAAEHYLRTGKYWTFCVVKRGRACGIFADKDEFNRQIYKFHGAVYRKFDWLPLAKEYWDSTEAEDILRVSPRKKAVSVSAADLAVHPAEDIPPSGAALPDKADEEAVNNMLVQIYREYLCGIRYEGQGGSNAG